MRSERAGDQSRGVHMGVGEDVGFFPERRELWGFGDILWY